MANIDSYIPDDQNEENPPENDSPELRSILEENDRDQKATNVTVKF